MSSIGGKGAAPTSRVIDAVQAVDPDSDLVDKLTYERIVPNDAG